MLDPSLPSPSTFVSTQLAAFWVVGPLYGINVTLAILTIVLLSRRGFSSGQNRYLVIAICLQLAVCTAHVVTLVVQMIRAFIGYPDFVERVTYLTHQELPVVLAQQALWFLNTTLGDCFMIWRVYIVWRNIILCIPFFLFEIALIITTSNAIHTQSTVIPPADLFTSHVRQWFIVICVMSLAIQCGGTGLIAWRVWSTPTRVTSSPHRRFNPVKILTTIADSGAIYAIFTLLVLASFLQHWYSVATSAAMLGQISATIPLSIMLRECWKASRDDDMLHSRPGFLTSSVYDVHERSLSPFGSRNSSDEHANLNVVVMKATHLHADPLLPASKKNTTSLSSRASMPRQILMDDMPTLLSQG